MVYSCAFGTVSMDTRTSYSRSCSALLGLDDRYFDWRGCARKAECVGHNCDFVQLRRLGDVMRCWLLLLLSTLGRWAPSEVGTVAIY